MFHVKRRCEYQNYTIVIIDPPLSTVCAGNTSNPRTGVTTRSEGTQPMRFTASVWNHHDATVGFDAARVRAHPVDLGNRVVDDLPFERRHRIHLHRVTGL